MADRHRPGQSQRSKLLGSPRKIIKRRRSTGYLRSNFKVVFLKRLKTCRSKSVDRFRNLVEAYGDSIDYQSVPTLRHMLQGDPEASTLMQNAEVNEVLHRIEVEMAEVDLSSEEDNVGVDFNPNIAPIPNRNDANDANRDSDNDSGAGSDVGIEIGDAVGNAIVHRVDDAFDNPVVDAFDDPVGVAFDNPVGVAFDDPVGLAFDDPIGDPVGDAIAEAIAEAMGDSIFGPIIDIDIATDGDSSGQENLPLPPTEDGDMGNIRHQDG